MGLLVHESTQFKPFLRGPSQLMVSSSALNWRGLLVERHSADSGERPEAVAELNILALVCSRPWTGEHPDGRGGVVTRRNVPGSINLIVPGIVPAIFSRSGCEHVLCALEPSFVKEVEDELDRRPTQLSRSKMGIEDTSARHLISALVEEAGRGGPLGDLYADHLGHALATWLLLHETATKHTRASDPALPPRILRRVLDYMSDPTGKLDLRTLAAESGYSRRHFLRMFQTSTGHTPHQYVLNLRLKHAQELMKRRNTQLIDIAAASGFSSHAHMSKIFRQMLGVTPSEFRRRI